MPLNIEVYDAIFLPLDFGTMTKLVSNPLVKDIIKKVYESGLIIGYECYGTVALLIARLNN